MHLISLALLANIDNYLISIIEYAIISSLHYSVSQCMLLSHKYAIG